MTLNNSLSIFVINNEIFTLKKTIKFGPNNNMLHLSPCLGTPISRSWRRLQFCEYYLRAVEWADE